MPLMKFRRGPVTEERFVSLAGGREDVLEALSHALPDAGGDSFWLRGPRRSGKTSCLQELQVRSEQRRAAVVALYMDMRGFLDEEKTRLRDALFLGLRAGLRQATHLSGLRFGRDVLRQAGSSEDLARRILRRCDEAGVGCVLMVDEPFVLWRRSRPERFEALVRLARVFREAPGHSLIVSDKLCSGLMDAPPSSAGGLLEGLRTVDLSAFTDAECEAFFEHYEVPSDARDSMKDLAGPHPYLLHVLGAAWGRRGWKEEELSEAARIVSAEPPVRGATIQDLCDLSPAGRQFLVAVSRKGPAESLTDTQDREAVEDLLAHRWHIVRDSSRPTGLRFEGEILGTWVSDTALERDE